MLGESGGDQGTQLLSILVAERRAELEGAAGDTTGYGRRRPGRSEPPGFDARIGGALAVDRRVPSDSDAAARVEQTSAPDLLVRAVHRRKCHYINAGVEADSSMVGDAEPVGLGDVEVEGDGFAVLGSFG
jgi:hypothetical protein